MSKQYVLTLIFVLICGSLAIGREPEDVASHLSHRSNSSVYSAAVSTIVQKTNDLRMRNGLPPLEQIDYLANAASLHSEEMLELNFFSHTSPVPGREKPKDRVRLSGGWDTKIGENIYRASGLSPSELANRVMAAWEKSPSHYQNLINPGFNSVGVGIAGQGQDFTVTQVFSYQTIRINSLTASPKGNAITVSFEGHIREGSREGGVFINDHFLQPFSTANGDLKFSFEAPPTAQVSLSQKQTDTRFVQSLSFPVDRI